MEDWRNWGILQVPDSGIKVNSNCKYKYFLTYQTNKQMQEETNFQWIQRYFTQDLSKKELQNFLQKMETDNNFKREIEEHGKMKELATYLDHLDKFKRGVNIFKRKQEKTEHTQKDLKRYYSAKPVWRTKSSEEDSDENNGKLPIVVKAPKNGADCNGTIEFVLYESIPCTLELIISDYEKTVYQNSHIQPNTLSLDIEAAAFSTRHPGRYSWNLKPTNRKDGRKFIAAKGFFFIQKSLNPFAEE